MNKNVIIIMYEANLFIRFYVNKIVFVSHRGSCSEYAVNTRRELLCLLCLRHANSSSEYIILSEGCMSQ